MQTEEMIKLACGLIPGLKREDVDAAKYHPDTETLVLVVRQGRKYRLPLKQLVAEQDRLQASAPIPEPIVEPAPELTPKPRKAKKAKRPRKEGF